MNIIFIEPSSGFGGSGNALYNLLKTINRNRFNPIVIICHSGP